MEMNDDASFDTKKCLILFIYSSFFPLNYSFFQKIKKNYKIISSFLLCNETYLSFIFIIMIILIFSLKKILLSLRFWSTDI